MRRGKKLVRGDGGEGEVLLAEKCQMDATVWGGERVKPINNTCDKLWEVMGKFLR